MMRLLSTSARVACRPLRAANVAVLSSAPASTPTPAHSMLTPTSTAATRIVPLQKRFAPDGPVDARRRPRGDYDAPGDLSTRETGPSTRKDASRDRTELPEKCVRS